MNASAHAVRNGLPGNPNEDPHEVAPSDGSNDGTEHASEKGLKDKKQPGADGRCHEPEDKRETALDDERAFDKRPNPKPAPEGQEHAERRHGQESQSRCHIAKAGQSGTSDAAQTRGEAPGARGPIRLHSPQIANVFDTGTVQVQGKGPVDLVALFEGLE